MIGEQIGPYEIIREMGRGAMGAVYRARRRDLNREFAVKFMMVGADDPRLRERFVREARAAARMAGHPAIVTVHDVGEYDGRPYMVMDIVEGRSLEAIARDGELTPLEAAAVMVKAARAMHAAHEAGVVHRDLKPANILLADSRMPRITDFGLAKLQAADEHVSRLTQSAELLGTPSYMAPEQVRGADAAPAADIYALGATLYELCTGRPPFEGGTILETLQSVLEGDPAPPRRANPSIPAPLEAVILRCLAKEPERRYPTAAALAEDLERVLRGEAVATRASARFARVTRRAQRHPLAVTLGVTVVGLLAVGGVWIAQRSGKSQEADAAAGRTHAAAARADQGTELQQCWRVLWSASGAAMRRLEDRWHDVEHGPADADLATVAAAVRAAEAAHPGLVLPRAWLAFGRFLAGDEQAGEQALRGDAAQAVDPFPCLFLARIALLRFGGSMRLPSIWISDGVVTYEKFEFTAEQRTWQQSVARELRAAARTELWPHAGHVIELDRYLAGVGHFEQRRYSEAVAALQPLHDDALLQGAAASLSGLALLLDGRNAESARAWQRLAARGWPHAYELLGLALVAEAGQLVARGEDPRERYREALEALEAASAVRESAPLWLSQGIVWGEIAGARLKHGAPGVLEALEQAARCFQQVGRVERGYVPWLNLAGTHRKIARERLRARHDPMPDYRRALDAVDRMLDAQAPVALAEATRARIYAEMASFAQRGGASPMDAFDRGVAAFEAALTAKEEAPLLSDLGRLLVGRAEHRLTHGLEGAGADLEHASACLQRALELRPGHWRTLQHQGRLESARGQLAKKQRRDTASAYRASVAKFTESLQQRPEDSESLLLRGKSGSWLADALPKGSAERIAARRSAIADFDAVLEQRPGDPAALVSRAVVRSLCAQDLQAAGEDPQPLLRGSLADWDALLAQAPKSWRRHASRAEVLENMGRFDDAKAGYEAGLLLADERGRAYLKRRLAGLAEKLGR